MLQSEDAVSYLWLPMGSGWREGNGLGALGLADASYSMYVKVSHFAVHQKQIQHCKSTVFQLNEF